MTEMKSFGRHVVKRGDTLWSIARQYGVMLADLLSANPEIRNPNLIFPDQEIVIPQKPTNVSYEDLGTMTSSKNVEKTILRRSIVLRL